MTRKLCYWIEQFDISIKLLFRLAILFYELLRMVLGICITFFGYLEELYCKELLREVINLGR